MDNATFNKLERMEAKLDALMRCFFILSKDTILMHDIGHSIRKELHSVQDDLMEAKRYV